MLQDTCYVINVTRCMLQDTWYMLCYAYYMLHDACYTIHVTPCMSQDTCHVIHVTCYVIPNAEADVIPLCLVNNRLRSCLCDSNLDWSEMRVSNWPWAYDESSSTRAPSPVLPSSGCRIHKGGAGNVSFLLIITIMIIIIFMFQISGCQTAPWFTMCALSPS